jgi:hypothetical protein
MIQKLFNTAFGLYMASIVLGALLIGGLIACDYISRFGLKFPG